MANAIEDYRAAIAKNVRRLRNERGFSQVQLTMKSGIPQTSLSKIEKKGQPFTFVTAYKLAWALGCTIHDLIPERSTDVETALAELHASLG